MSESRDRKISSVDVLILGLLAERSMHGYEINRVLSSDLMKLWIEVPVPSIYASLAKLKNRSLVGETVERGARRLERNIFHITDKGRQEFLDMLGSLITVPRPVHIDYNIPIYFMNRLAPDKTIEAIKEKKKFLRRQLSALNEGLAGEKGEVADSPCLSMVLEQTKRVMEVRLEMADEIIHSLKGKGKISKTEGSSLEYPLAVFRGNLSETALPGIISLIGRAKRTGKLTFQNDHFSRSIFFKEGKVVAAGVDSLKKSVLQEILEIFTWSEGEFIFCDSSPDTVPEKNMTAMNIMNEDLILSGCAMVDEWSKIGSVVSSTDMVFDESDGTKSILDGVPMTEKHQEVLTLVNGVRDVDTLAKMTHLSPFEVSRLIYGLVSVGVLTSVPRDKAKAVGLLKHTSSGLFKRLNGVGARQLGRIEKEFNKWAEENTVPFRITKRVMVDDIKSGLALSALTSCVRQSIQALVEAATRYAGESLTDEAMRSIAEYMPPDLYALASRYGFQWRQGK